MALMEMVQQLTKGFVKATGRQPDNLEKLKIQQEAVQRFKDMNKVVDMEGNVIDTSKGIIGGKQIQENKEFGKALKEELMKTENPFSDLVKTTEKGPKSLQQRRKEAEEALKNKNVVPFKDPENMATGGRAGFKLGTGKKGIQALLDLFKNKKMFRSKDDVPTSVFSEKTGPITIEDMANIPEKELSKIRRTQELGLYDETPEILKAGNLFERFTKKVGGKRVIDYDRAEFILNRKLKGNETLNDLLQIEYQTRPGRADGGRAGYADGTPELKLYPRASGRETEQEVGPGIKISERDLNYGITGLLEGDKFFGGAELDKGKVKIDVLSPEGDTLFKDTIGKEDAVNFILGMGDPKGEKFQIKTDKDFENMQVVFRKSFADGGRIGLKKGMDRRTFMKIMGGLATLPIVGKFAKGAKLAAPAVKKVAEITAPALDKIVDTVMSAGKLVSQSGRKLKELTTKKKLKDIEVEEDMLDGPSYTIKTKDKTIFYKPGKQDEMGFDEDIIEVIEDKITKKAGGGIARMLGE
jgi:hypothetical protein